MPETVGLNHLGLTVKNLHASKSFFVEGLGWTESGFDASYPRTAVSDGVVRLTLWQVDHNSGVTTFNRKHNVGLHHLALEVKTEEKLNAVYQKIKGFPGVKIKFSPELVGDGPRKHMMCFEPGGIRVEFIWPGV